MPLTPWRALRREDRAGPRGSPATGPDAAVRRRRPMAAPTPINSPRAVRWSGVRPVRRRPSPSGLTAFSTGARNRRRTSVRGYPRHVNLWCHARYRRLSGGRSARPPASRDGGGTGCEELPAEKVRNVVLLGHGGAGKTSLAEALLVRSGAISRAGKVDDGTSVLDTEPESVKRKISLSLGLAPFEWKATDGETYKVNLLDTLGTPTSSVRSRQRWPCATSRCSSSAPSTASRCRPRSCGASPQPAACRACSS